MTRNYKIFASRGSDNDCANVGRQTVMVIPRNVAVRNTFS